MNELHFAVVVGINRYPGMENQLSSARRDAEEFHSWLTSPDEGGVRSEHAKLITASPEEEKEFTDQWEAHPLRQQVIATLGKFHAKVQDLGDASWRKTRLYLYLAGHGVVPPAGLGALLFADASPPAYWSEVLDLKQYAELYGKFTPFYELVLLADCCRQVLGGMPAVSEPPFGDRQVDRPRDVTRCVLGFAAGHGYTAGAPSAGESDDGKRGRGFFTRALLQGLRGEEGVLHDPVTGVITSDHLDDYIRKCVPKLAQAYDHQQQAYIERVRGGAIELARVTPKKFKVELRLPAGWTGQLRIVISSTRQGQMEIFSTAQARGNLIVLLSNGIYKAYMLPEGRHFLFEVEGEDRVVVP